MLARLAQTVRAAPFAAAGAALPGVDGRIAEPDAGVEPRAKASAALANVQILRGIAAFLVLIHHIAAYGESQLGLPQPSYAHGQIPGVMGVAVFFAISGFLMAGLVSRDDPWRFLAHRVVRIFPTFLVVVALSAVVFAALGQEFVVKLAALTLVPVGPQSYPLNVEWTLIYETSFYVGLFLLALTGAAARLVVPAAVGWLGILAVAWFVLPPELRDVSVPPPYLLPISTPCVAFAGGLLLPHLIASGRMRPSLAWLAVPLVVTCLWLDRDAQRWIGGIGAVLIVGAAASGPQFGRESLIGRAATRLGDWSYVLYLVHVPVILLVARYAYVDGSIALFSILCVTASLGVTALLGPLDVALYRRLRRAVDRSSRIGLRGGIAVYLALFFGLATFAGAQLWQESARRAAVQRALSGLPASAWLSASAAETSIADMGIALPASLRSGLDGLDQISPNALALKAWAFDPARPDEQPAIALLCGGRLAALDLPRRARADVAARPGLEAARGRRIGYALRLPVQSCLPGSAAVIALIGSDGRMAVMAQTLSPSGPLR